MLTNRLLKEKDKYMEVANARMRLNKVGSDVPITDMTPAEAMLLHILHGPSNGGLSFGEEFEKITVTGTAKVKDDKGVLRDRTDVEELKRLRAKYGGARDKTNKSIIDSIWPNKLQPNLPKTFKEIKWTEVADAGFETASINYATGALSTPSLPTK